MKNILIFDNVLGGHHLEYLHHIYEGGVVDLSNRYIFLVPGEFVQVQKKFEWPESTNVKIVYMDNCDVDSCVSGGYVRSSWNYAKVLRKYVKKFSIDSVFLITLIYPFPFLPLFFSRKVQFSGIVYRIYLYEWDKLSFLKKIKDVLETWVMAKAKCVKSIFVLNDNSSACYYNKLFKSKKFKSIIDPVLPLTVSPCDIRSELGICRSQSMYLHFGAMNARKGTLLILKALLQIPKEDLKDKVFVFAGKIGKDINNEFFELVAQLQHDVKIIVFNEFCSYEKLADLCTSSDFILIPYKNTSYSSGVVGYASLFNKTVIGPGDGILGKLILRNNLGFVMPSQTVQCLADLIKSAKKIRTNGEKYVQKNNVSNFVRSIVTDLKN